jgi:alpha-ketoglutarate-dependent taurine dioxygenase
VEECTPLAHGVHPESPCRDVFRLSNDSDHGFNSVGPEWHNDGSFCRDVFGHVVYHIVKAPDGAGDTQFAHLGNGQGRSLVHYSAQLERFVWDTGCA